MTRADPGLLGLPKIWPCLEGRALGFRPWQLDVMPFVVVVAQSDGKRAHLRQKGQRVRIVMEPHARNAARLVDAWVRAAFFAGLGVSSC